VARSDDETLDAEGSEYEVSKSQRKREASALQDLGVALVSMPASELDLLPLTEKLRDAVDLAKRLEGNHGALFRQRQYIGKLMRHIDVTPIVAALDAKSSAQTERARSFHILEQWRDRLINEGDAALDAFVARYPQANLKELKTLVGRVYGEKSQGDARISTRALFRAIRSVIEASEAADSPTDSADRLEPTHGNLSP